MLLIFLILYSISVVSQNNVMKVPVFFTTKYTKFYDLKEVREKSKICYLENLLPQKEQEGVVDYTFIIQKVINSNDFIVFPKKTLLINKKGLMIPSNKILFFQKESQLKFLGPADSRKSDILKIYNSSNVKIYNLSIVGSRYRKINQKGEWSAGVAILNSKNIGIYNFKIEKTFGDGIIIADKSSKVVIKNGWIDTARRDGISITSADDVSISNVLISNTYGTLPQCGIQIEPNFYSDDIKNINISNIIGYNNSNATFNINLGPLNLDYKNEMKEVSVKIKDVSDYYSGLCLGFVMNPDNKKYKPKGIITIKNVKATKSKNFYWKDDGEHNIVIKTENLIQDSKLLEIK